MYKKFSWNARVYYEDTDAGGVVYHARYLAFYERARTEILRSFGIVQHNLLQEQIAFVVVKMSIDYKRPAMLDDLLTIETEIKSLSKASLIFSQRILNEQGVIINQAEVTIACINLLTKKVLPLPKFFTNNLIDEDQ